MASHSLEQRVAAKAHQANGTQEKPWLRSMGMFAGDVGMKEVFEQALKLRSKDRERSHRRAAGTSRPRRAKK